MEIPSSKEMKYLFWETASYVKKSSTSFAKAIIVLEHLFHVYKKLEQWSSNHSFKSSIQCTKLKSLSLNRLMLLPVYLLNCLPAILQTPGTWGMLYLVLPRIKNPKTNYNKTSHLTIYYRYLNCDQKLPKHCIIWYEQWTWPHICIMNWQENLFYYSTPRSLYSLSKSSSETEVN